jgi:hypothetical protein
MSSVTPIFFNKSVTLVSRNISGKFKKNLSTQFSRIKFRLFWQFLSTIFFYFSIMKSWSMYLLMYKFSGCLTELVLEIITVLFRVAKAFHTRRRISRITRTKKFLVSSKYQIYIVFSCLKMQTYLVLHANSG